VRVVFKNLVVHQQVTEAHLAGCAAAKQGKFNEFKRDWWEKGFKTRQMDHANILAIAQGVGLDMAKLEKDMGGDDCRARLANDAAELNKFHVQATPSFFVNGAFLGGAMPKENFEQLIESKLKLADASGVPCPEYYDKEVIGKGEKQFRSKMDPK
jgi:predicted DsbA family dithiol-disulfide isomerase